MCCVAQQSYVSIVVSIVLFHYVPLDHFHVARTCQPKGGQSLQQPWNVRQMSTDVYWARASRQPHAHVVIFVKFHVEADLRRVWGFANFWCSGFREYLFLGACAFQTQRSYGRTPPTSAQLGRPYCIFLQ